MAITASATSHRVSLEAPMGEEAARDFLKKHRVKNFDAEAWRPGVPLLYIFHSSLRAGVFGGTEGIRPTLARLDNPTEVVPGAVMSHGQVDYYAIDIDSKHIFLLRTTNNISAREYGVQSPRSLLFFSNDELFPKSA